MNEPALPAEAFAPNYQPDAGENAIYSQHATAYGWSANTAQLDSIWQNQWNTISATNRNQWVNTLSSSSYVTAPQPLYYLRWGQQRPAGEVPDSAPFNSTPQRGPWKGIFAGNLSETTIINTYNAGDGVLIEDWGLTQTTQEPFFSGAGFLSDDATNQFWAALKNTDPGQESVWGDSCSSIGTCQHSNIIRQWAELAYWFPSLSDAAGLRPLTGIQGASFSNYAPPPSSTGVGLLLFSSPTHSYLTESVYPSVFPAWRQIRGFLQ